MAADLDHPYWAIAWAPSVGLFIAKISYGRTIRVVVVAVVLCPALVNSLWLTTFANSAFYEHKFGNGMLKIAESRDCEAAIFELLRALPWSGLGVLLSMVCMFPFAITSTNSASFTLANLTAKEPGAHHRTWAVVEN